MTVEVKGEVARRYEGVRDAFAANFERFGEVGAAFCLHVRGEKVVDVWGGVADEETGRAYDEDTLQLVFSTSKGATAVCANLLAQRGDLDLDAPVAEYWPEFAAEGKAGIPVRWLLTHQAGLPVIDPVLSLEQVLAWDPVIDALAAQAPVWEPGTAHGYHALTYGWLVGEVIRRVTGVSLGKFLAAEVAGPLGLDLWIGLPESEEHRVAPLIPLEQPTDPDFLQMMDMFIGPDTLLGRALRLNGALAGDEAFNLPEVHAAEIPAANAICTARSLSRLYASLIGEVDGMRLLEPATAARARTCQTTGNDKVIFLETRFGLGFMLDSAFSPMGGPAGFGHPGFGGSVGFADPDAELAFGYVMNHLLINMAGDPRTVALIEAAYQALR